MKISIVLSFSLFLSFALYAQENKTKNKEEASLGLKTNRLPDRMGPKHETSLEQVPDKVRKGISSLGVELKDVVSIYEIEEETDRLQYQDVLFKSSVFEIHIHNKGQKEILFFNKQGEVMVRE
jgi:hypothetical protein